MAFEALAGEQGEQEILAGFSERVRGWWRERFGGFSAPQRLAVPTIQRGESVLVCAPT